MRHLCALFSKLSCLVRMSEVCVSVLEACCGGMYFPRLTLLKMESNIFVSLQRYKWNIKKCSEISIWRFAIAECFVPQYSCVEVAGFKVMLFGDGALGMQLGLAEVMRMTPHVGLVPS